tara:strand:+ start:372 stop:914 length:543 start_codon:yes stop_codon:yes gene_type:complete
MKTTKCYLESQPTMSNSDLQGFLSSQNSKFASDFSSGNIAGVAAKELLILTCMDSRIIPHQIFGLDIGDIKVIRNAGGQLNSEVEKDIILASHLLNCRTIVIMPHTNCAMASMPLADVQHRLKELANKDFSNFKPRMIDDTDSKLRADVEALQNSPLINDGIQVLGAFYDDETGLVNWLE